MTDLVMTNYEYTRIHLFMLLPNIGRSENVDQNAEPYSNQIWMILLPLDLDWQGEHGTCIQLSKFHGVHFPHGIYETHEDGISEY